MTFGPSLDAAQRRHPSPCPTENPKSIAGSVKLDVLPIRPPRATKTKPTSLLDLPLEIRERIYGFVFERLTTRIMLERETQLYRWTFQPRTLPDICFTSKQMWEESVLHFVRRTRFIAIVFKKNDSSDPSMELKNWLEIFPDGQGLRAVRMLSYPEDTLMEDLPSLILHCPGIRSLKIVLSKFR